MDELIAAIWAWAGLNPLVLAGVFVLVLAVFAYFLLVPPREPAVEDDFAPRRRRRR